MVSCIVFGWNWNVEICIHSPYPKDVWLLVAHNFAYCCRCWAWCVLRPSRFSWIFWIPCRFGISTPSTAVTRESPNEWLHEEANCLTCWTSCGRRWAMKAEEMQRLKEQAKGLCQVKVLRVSWCFSIIDWWWLMLSLIFLSQTSPKIHLGYFQRSFLSPRIPSPQSLLSPATTRHLGFVWGQVASLHVTCDGI